MSKDPILESRKASLKFQMLDQVSADRGKDCCTAIDLHIVLSLGRWMKDDFTMWRPQTLLAADLGLTLNGLRNSIDRLIARGHLKALSGGVGRGHATVYQFIIKTEKGNNGCTIEPKKEQQPLHVSEDKRVTAVPEKGNGGSHKRATAVTPTILEKSIEESLEKKESVYSLETEFNEIWHHYPRKKSPGEALKAFKAARKTVDLMTISAGVLRYAAERTNEDPKYTKYFATWLNAKCWADEPTAPHQQRTTNVRSDSKSRTGDISRALISRADEAQDEPILINERTA